MTEKRHGLVGDSRRARPTGAAERDAAIDTVADKQPGKKATLGGDGGYDAHGFVGQREMNVPPHVAQNARQRGRDLERLPTWFWNDWTDH